MKHASSAFLCAALAAAALAAPALATGFYPGYDPDPDRPSRLTVAPGAILSLSGSVRETFRSFYAATGQHEKQALAESYDFDDFNVDPPYFTLGLNYDRRGQFFGFRANAAFFSLSSHATAKRDYYLGIEDSISYKGRKYDHLKIPKDKDFSLSLDGTVMDFVFDFTPFTFFFGDDVRLSPSLDLGLALAGGRYEIDAGSPQGVYVYQNPPVDFVVGGTSSSFVGAPAPVIGGGLTLRVGEPELDDVVWTTRLNVDGFSYHGSTSVFSSSRSKNADLKLLVVSAETSWLFPLQSGNQLSIGARIRHFSIDGDITSKPKDVASIIAARERFDKSLDFDLLLGEFFIGLAF